MDAEVARMLPDSAPKRDVRSTLFKAMGVARARGGQVATACPFGCTTENEDYDEHGRCRHLIGFTLKENKTTFAPLKKREPTKNKDGKVIGAPDWLFEDGSDLQQVQPGDHLERITVSYRVYRKTPEDIAKAAEESAKIEQMTPNKKPK